MKLLRLLGFLFLLSFGSTIVFLQFVDPQRDTVSMTIESGMSVVQIADILKEHGVITSATAFRVYLKSKGLDTGIQPGEIQIPPDATFAQIATILSDRTGKQLSITIPEGFTVAQIDSLLTEKDFIKSGDINSCSLGSCDFVSFDFLPDSNNQSIGGVLEGYLFPDTYFVDPSDFVAKFFLERLLGTFRSRVIRGLSKEIEASGRSLKEIIIMASLIERETRTDSERPIVAGILWKRYDSNYGLDVDATVRYALNKESGVLTKTDLQTDSEYNTRRYAGLPPSPIANPGLASIRAALHPQESSYWYYLHAPDGQIYYSDTNEEHNEKKRKYL